MKKLTLLLALALMMYGCEQITEQPKTTNVYKVGAIKYYIIEIASYLKKHIGDNPNNLNEVFRKRAAYFGFATIGPIQRRWYGTKCGKTDYGKKPSCRNNIGPVYSVVGNNSTINGKNQAEAPVKKTRWLLNILFNAFKKDKYEKN